jgi:hypothetical protein
MRKPTPVTHAPFHMAGLLYKKLALICRAGVDLLVGMAFGIDVERGQGFPSGRLSDLQPDFTAPCMAE